MDFGTAVRALYDRYADFQGRSGRAAFWFGMLYLFVGSLVAGGLERVSGIPFLSLLWSLAHFVPGIALAVRRLHDTGHSGFLVLLQLIPVLGFIILAFVSYIRPSVPPNDYGTPADPPLI